MPDDESRARCHIVAMTVHALAEDIMKTNRRRHFTRRLEAERANLTSALRDLEREAELDAIESVPDRLSRDALPDAEVAEAAASVELAKLHEIDAALQRLRDHPEQFGVCIVCKKPIENARLELIPWTQRCAPHAAAADRAERTEIETLAR